MATIGLPERAGPASESLITTDDWRVADADPSRLRPNKHTQSDIQGKHNISQHDRETF